ncbi:alpha/beta hydrolase [Roseomonas gilardii]|uniref:Alpha/beta hydrolase n=1 Tax=Roseomonas gilardii TaxID=257708 RepID=A0A1L7ALE3_9PROT|nr:alpha/beta fold hydrolase [Roseomonas gilardii]APT59564.1 alpha/beta hydrolase [Roseomonas gilardii]
MIVDRSCFLRGRTRTGVLLIHGLGGTPAEMVHLGRSLYGTGAHVLCCQLAGHCGTEEQLAGTGWRDWYASAEAALTRLSESCDTVIVGGLSMGAVLAARLAREEPERVQGLVLLAPTLRYDGWAMPRFSFLLRGLVHLPFGRRYRFREQEPFGIKDPRIRRWVQKSLTTPGNLDAGLEATPALAIREMWRLVADMRGTLPEIRQDTLLIHAREDDVASLRNAFHFQRHLGGRVETLVLEDSYHIITVDRQRQVVNRRVADFVRQFGDRDLAPLSVAPEMAADNDAGGLRDAV